MTDDATEQKSWLERLGDLLSREPNDREQLVDLLRSAEDRHLLDAEALSMIEGVLQVSDMRVRDIMVPRAQMIVIAHDATLEQCLPIITESRHSRFPVIAENKDEIAGILLAKELLVCLQNREAKFNVRKLMRPAMFIPESKRLNVLLKEFRLNHNHMAIVVDEYAGIAGLVTIEDVLEQIVGDIEDESDREEDNILIKQISDNQFTVKALTPIEEFNEYFNAKFSDAEFDTIGGLVMQSFGHLPKRDEVTELTGFRFKILHADHRRIRLMKVTKI